MGGARRPPGPGAGPRGAGPGLSPTFRVERCFGSRGEGGVGSAEQRGRAGPDWNPVQNAARSTAGAEPPNSQSGQSGQSSQSSQSSCSQAVLADPCLPACPPLFPALSEARGIWGSGCCDLRSHARSAIAPALCGHGLSTKYAGGRSQCLHPDGLGTEEEKSQEDSV